MIDTSLVSKNSVNEVNKRNKFEFSLRLGVVAMLPSDLRRRATVAIDDKL